MSLNDQNFSQSFFKVFIWLLLSFKQLYVYFFLYNIHLLKLINNIIRISIKILNGSDNSFIRYFV